MTNDTPDRPGSIPVRFVAEADQLEAAQDEFGDAAIQLVVVALAEAALAGDDGSEELRFPE